MKTLTLFAAMLTVSAPALAMKPCEELKTEIAAQIEANHVAGYRLEIVPNDNVGDRKVVGSCDGGTRKIVYERRDPAMAADHHAGPAEMPKK